MMIRSLFLTTAVVTFMSCGVPQTAQADRVACTMDAKLCPDGSAVGRTGPDCEFAACPGEEADDSGSTDDSEDQATDGDDSGATLPDDADADADADTDTPDDGATGDMEHETE